MSARRPRLLLLAAISVTAVSMADPAPPRPDEKPAKGVAVEIALEDDGRLKALLLDESITLITPYGRLQIPSGEIETVEFATRLSETLDKQVGRAVLELGDREFQGPRGGRRVPHQVPRQGLSGGREGQDRQGSRGGRAGRGGRRGDRGGRAARATCCPRLRRGRHCPLAHLRPDSKSPSLKLRTEAFGELTLKLHDAVGLRGGSASAPVEEGEVADAPPTLMQLQQQVGKIFRYKAVGVLQGSVWGTDVYTLDSQLGAAAVHAGALKNGQTGVVKVRVIAGQPAYNGSIRNGVTSSNYAVFPASYQFVK